MFGGKEYLLSKSGKCDEVFHNSSPQRLIKRSKARKEKSKNTFSTGGFHFEHRTLSVVIALPAFVCLAAEQLTIKCKNKYVWCNKDEELLSAA